MTNVAKPKKLKKSKLRSNEGRLGYIFTLPWMIGFLAFFAFPIIYSLMLSFSYVRDITHYSLEFIGLENYVDAFFTDTEFTPALLSSLGGMCYQTPIIVIFSLFIAILLNRNLKGKGIFRVAFFLPVLLGTGVVLSTINGSIGDTAGDAATMAAQAAAQESAGDSAGISQQTSMLVMFLGKDIALALQTVLDVVTGVFWMSGIQIIIFLGALQNIPSSYYEAAYVDGASEWEKFWKITLPLTMPNILLNTVYTMIDFLSSTDNEVVVFCANKATSTSSIAFASASAWIHFLTSGILILLVFLILRKFTFYQDE